MSKKHPAAEGGRSDRDTRKARQRRRDNLYTREIRDIARDLRKFDSSD